MPGYRKFLAALGFGLVALFGSADASSAQQSAVTAIDIALEPDATMIQHAQADNARLLQVFPKGFALDATHHPHISMLQQFVPLISTWSTPRQTRFFPVRSRRAGS
jgi:hypothetical protein